MKDEAIQLVMSVVSEIALDKKVPGGDRLEACRLLMKMVNPTPSQIQNALEKDQ